MALRKGGEAAAAAQTQAAPGGFEGEDPTAGAAVKEAGPVVTSEAKAGVAASTAIAKAATTAVAKSSGKAVMLLDDKKDQMPAVEFGTLTRLVGTNGLVMDKDNKKLGNFVTLEVISWNDSYVLSPGVDDAEAKESVRYSLDGVTIADTGQSCAEYLTHLREVEKYENASMKKYTEVVGILIDAGTKVEELMDTLVQLSLSPSSRKLFDGYRMQEFVKIRMGKRTEEGAEVVKFTADVRTQNGKNFTVLKATAA